MKNFNKFAEAVLISAEPQSDSAGEIGGYECPCNDEQPMDMFSQSADDVMSNIGGDMIQPDDDVGETGDIQSDSEEGSDIQIECTDDGMWIKFGGFEMIIPVEVAKAIKKHVMEKIMDKMTEDEDGDSNETEAEEEHEEHEAGESEEKEEKEEHAKEETDEDEEAEEHEAEETEEEEEDEEDEDDNVEEAFKHIADKGKTKEDDIYNKIDKRSKKVKCKKCKNIHNPDEK